VPRRSAASVRAEQRVVRFFERHLKQTKGRWTGQPFILEPFQRDEIIRPIYGRLDKSGLRVTREALILLARKGAKSTLTAGLGLYHLLADGEGGAEVYTAAAKKEQAGIVFSTARRMIEMNPMLAAACKPYKSVIEVPETGAIMKCLSSDFDGGGKLHGLNPSASIIDELWAHRNSDVYDALTSADAARAQPLTLNISTVGPRREGPLWDLYQRALAGDDKALFMVHFGAKPGMDPHDPATWRYANPAPWIALEYLERQHRRMPLALFEQLHLNRWPEKGVGAWMSEPLWESNGAKPHIDPDEPAYLAVDAAPKKDTTAVALVQKDTAGILNVLVWVFRADDDLGYLDYAAVEELIRDLHQDFYLERIAFDPHTMIRTMMMLDAEGLPVEDFPQSVTRMTKAADVLYRAIVDGRLAHGNDPELAAAMRAAAIRETPGGFMFHKRKSEKPIDALTAVTMAVFLAEAEDDAGFYAAAG
jgi:phage terminase large subunit-like protein